VTNTRTLVLAVAALGMLALLAVRTLTSDGASPGARNAGGSGSSVAEVTTLLPVGAPLDLDPKQLAERYAKIEQSDPFAKSDFRPKRTPRPTRQDPRPERVVPTAAPPPDTIELRLTGLTGEGEERRAVFEHRAERKALLVTNGWEHEEMSIAAVETFTVKAVDKGRERTLNLGDSLTLPLSVRPMLIDIAKASSSAAERPYRPSGSTETPEPISDDKRQSILERLRAKREASLKNPPSGD